MFDMEKVKLEEVREPLRAYLTGLTGYSFDVLPESYNLETKDDFIATRGNSKRVYLPDESSKEAYKLLASWYAGKILYGSLQPEKRYPHPSFRTQLYQIVEQARINHHLCRKFPGLAQLAEKAIPEMFQESIEKKLKDKGIPGEGIEALRKAKPEVFPKHYFIVEKLHWVSLKSDLIELDDDMKHYFKIISPALSNMATANTSIEKSEELYQEVIKDKEITELLEEHLRKNERKIEDLRNLIGNEALKEGRISASSMRGNAMLRENLSRAAQSHTHSQLNFLAKDITESTNPRNEHEFWHYEKSDNPLFSTARVIEHKVEPIMTQDIPSLDQKIMAQLKREFEFITPSELGIVRKLRSGELDPNAYMQLQMDKAAGIDPDERIYFRKLKNRRSVSTVVLADLSGSTNKPANKDQSILDVVKESMAYLAAGIEQVGDDYALFGYSGETRLGVDFYLIKDFDNRFDPKKLFPLKGMEQNRDGAALRHAAHKLLKREMKNKILLHISDGEPQDLPDIVFRKYLDPGLISGYSYGFGKSKGLLARQKLGKLTVPSRTIEKRLFDSERLQRHKHISDIRQQYQSETAWKDIGHALREMRAKGVTPFCIRIGEKPTRDSGEAYGTRMRFIQDPNDLPKVLYKFYRNITT